jgi:hypothetical protein
MKEARSVDKVLDKIISIIPEQEIELKTELKMYLDSLYNKAPEVRRSHECWIPLRNILISKVPIFDENWKCLVLQEFNGSNHT